MSPRGIVIVGAGPAGLATARAYREHGGTGEVTLLGKETLIPYRRPPLTKEFLRGELDASELPIQSQDWFDEHDIHLCLERVFAVGDVAYAHNRSAGRRLRVEHWGDALGQGEIAGCVLAGQDAHWQEVPGFWSSIGQHTIKYTGRQLIAAGESPP